MNATIVDEPQNPSIREKPCAACGERFSCCAGGCWCDTVSLAEPTRARLLERYVDCLCPTCLREAASLDVR